VRFDNCTKNVRKDTLPNQLNPHQLVHNPVKLAGNIGQNQRFGKAGETTVLAQKLHSITVHLF
jgi:hypothetical protein